jgi:hypothetical protein
MDLTRDKICDLREMLRVLHVQVEETCAALDRLLDATVVLTDEELRAHAARCSTEFVVGPAANHSDLVRSAVELYRRIEAQDAEISGHRR